MMRLVIGTPRSARISDSSSSSQSMGLPAKCSARVLRKFISALKRTFAYFVMLSEVKHLRLSFQRWLEKQSEILRERSEEHTSELQSQSNLVCRLLLDK